MAYETYSRAALALIRLFFIKFFTTKVYVVAKSAAITCLLSDQNNHSPSLFEFCCCGFFFPPPNLAKPDLVAGKKMRSNRIQIKMGTENNQGDQMFFPKNRSFFRQKSQVLSQENYQLQQKSQVFRKISQVFRETDVLKKALFRTESSPAEESTYACSFY